MVHARVSDEYIYFISMYMTDNILPVLQIKQLVNQDSETTTRHKMATGKKTLVSNLRVLFCSCVVQKATAHVYTKALNMLHQSQRYFWGIFVGIPQHQRCDLIYSPRTKKRILHILLYLMNFSSELAYTSHP